MSEEVGNQTTFTMVRFGNVLGSSGSVIPVFREQIRSGESVKIVDLARRMIVLSGLTVKDTQNPDGDIEIIYSGLRSGEKLYEELLTGKAVTGTEHPKIFRAYEEFLDWEACKRSLDEITGTLNGH